jgi:hypothetical protein
VLIITVNSAKIKENLGLFVEFTAKQKMKNKLKGKKWGFFFTFENPWFLESARQPNGFWWSCDRSYALERKLNYSKPF